jgi:hypothetical protein
MTAIMSENVKKDLIIRSIKILDIGYLTIIYFISGYSLSWLVNKIYKPFDPQNPHSSKPMIFLEVCLQLFLISIIVYIIRNIVMLFPWPLEGVYGYEHARVKELYNGGVALSFGVFYAQSNLTDKMKYIIG